jgi:hypothetical protein
MVHTMQIPRFVKRCKELADAHGERFAPCELLNQMYRSSEVFHAG